MKVNTVNLLEHELPQYRLGDAVLNRGTTYGDGAFSVILRNKDKFEGSLLLDYALKIDKSSTDPQWHILKNCVEKKVTELGLMLPAKDELVVHLRLGNVKGFDQEPEVLVDCIEGLIAGNEIIVSAVTIVTVIHFGKGYIEKSRESHGLSTEICNNRRKVDKIFALFNDRNIKAKLYSHEDIDRDFCYLSNAWLLVLGKGYFSCCAAMISDGEIFIPPWVREGTAEDVEINKLLNQ